LTWTSYGAIMTPPITHPFMDGLKVFIDGTVLEKVDAVRPGYISRTAWINQVLDREACRLRAAEQPYACAEVGNG